MKVTIPFNEKIFRDQMALNFFEVWNRHISGNKRNLIGGSIGITIGAGVLSFGSNLGFVLIGLGLHYVFNAIDYYRFYKREKKEYHKSVDEEVANYSAAKSKSIWCFEEEYLHYQDHKYETKIQWSSFKGYSMVDQTLFLHLDHKKSNSMAIGRREIKTSEDWDRILTIVDAQLSLMN